MRKSKLRKQLDENFGLPKDEKFHIDLIGDYYKKKRKTGERVLSDRTCHDLDFDEFYMFADRTVSRVGQQYLYAKLRLLPNQIPDFSQQEKRISFLTDNPDKRLDMQVSLAQVSSHEAYHINSLFQDKLVERPSWFIGIRFLAIISLSLVALAPFFPQALIALLGVIVVNLIIHYWNKGNLYQYTSAIPQLLRLNKVAKDLYKHQVWAEGNRELSHALKTIDRLNSRMRFFQLEAKLESDSSAILWGMIEMLKLVFLLEPLLLFSSLKLIDKHSDQVKQVFAFVGEVDVMISIVSLRKDIKFCKPYFYEVKGQLRAQEVYHPLINNCIANDLLVNNKSVLLTGSNMSGKTSFIRTIGLNTVSAYTLNTCFANVFELPIMHIYSAIRINDDLMNDKSYYFEEVVTLKHLMDEGRKSSCLFLLDELYKGTNTVERIAAGKAVLCDLNQANNIVIVATHDLEMTEMLSEGYDLYHFCELVSNKGIDFDYRLKSGKLEKTNAIKILEVNDYPIEVIAEAKRMVRQLS